MPNVKVQRKRGTRSKSEALAGGALTWGQVAKLALTTFGTEPVDAGFGSQHIQMPAAVVATATAWAENQGFVADKYNGICCDGLLQVNRIHRNSSWAVSYFGRALSEAEFAKEMHKPNLNFWAAHNIWLGAGKKFGVAGGGGNPWEAFGNAAYIGAIPKAQQAVEAILKGLDPDKLGVVEGGLTNPGEIVSDAVEFIGRKSAEWFIGAVKWVGKLIYSDILHPQWEHGQRMFVFYFRDIMSGKAGTGYYYSYAGLVTVVFWSVGYAILWRDAEDITARRVEVERTPIGLAVSKAKEANTNRKVYKPSEAKKTTPKKPKPRVSSAEIEKVRSARVQRKRTVGVEWTKEEGAKVKAETETTETEPQQERTPVNDGAN